ncbi:MucB/RseB C-terminal domain-containing protein [Spongiibacter nanhainus]
MRRQVRSGLALFFVGACLASPLTSFASPAQWLLKMTESHRQLNYQGIFTYQIGEQVSSFRISHTVRDGKEFESLESLDGEHRDLVRQGHDVHCVHPGPELIRLKVAGDPGVDYSYIVDMEGRQRVAGRQAVSLAIRPRDTHRLGYRLALDEQTGLLLRSDIISQQGKMLERFQYVMLELGEAPASMPTPVATSHSKFNAVADDAGRAALPWKPAWVPSGFTLVPAPEPAADSGQSYTDGLAVLSIFVEALETSTVREGSMRRGASVSYTTSYPEYSKLVTVVGEVPMSTAKRVAESIRWNNDVSQQQVLQ